MGDLARLGPATEQVLLGRVPAQLGLADALGRRPAEVIGRDGGARAGR